MQNYITNGFGGIANGKSGDFVDGVNKVINSIDVKQGVFTGDNLLTYNRNLSFLDDTSFVNSVASNTNNEI